MTAISEFTLLLPGDPVPKGRPRVYRGHAVTPKRTVQAENRLEAEFRRKYPQTAPYQCPVRLDAEFWMSHKGRPDLDNLLKLVLDGLNGVAYLDDKQVVETHAFKRVPDPWAYGAHGRYRKRKSGDPYTSCGHEYEPHLYVRVRPLPEWTPTV
ncbi:RusA family crossover junction endodeoxyribonuclease [Bifidobacterium sp. SO4]|uniref:RusA family crossover junction endodeoxyribonuclease n=1 Tax=Bifidobacterium sp. SO4 TaxID=2809030 RepID=UPI001BDCDDE5|nr:RusA family crossover junction endodeoxyribonuclease [Bifidobacterium sp. SO4]MBT1171717.1 RusA family crossover junction endodeoxyribonuclease [Bifidobacterium sp. SO4]